MDIVWTREDVAKAKKKIKQSKKKPKIPKKPINRISIQKINNKRRFFNRLNELGISSYAEYLQSDYWFFKKEKMYNSKRLKECFCCGSNGNLDIHHRKYKARDIDNLNTSSLVYLCRDCHEKVHKMEKKKPNISVNQATKRLRKSIQKKCLTTNLKRE